MGLGHNFLSRRCEKVVIYNSLCDKYILWRPRSWAFKRHPIHSFILKRVRKDYCFRYYLKGQSHEIFDLCFFPMNRHHMDPWVKPLNFDFGFDFVEIFEFERCSTGPVNSQKLFIYQAPRKFIQSGLMPRGNLFRGVSNPAQWNAIILEKIWQGIRTSGKKVGGVSEPPRIGALEPQE